MKKLMMICAAVLIGGCSTSDSAQPAKSQVQNNTFDDCIIIVAAKVRLPTAGTNKMIIADGGDLPTLEMFTNTQSLESSGTETYSPTATQTPTTDVKPDLDVHYNDAVGKGGDAVSALMQVLTPAAASLLQSKISEKYTGTLTLDKTDGSTVQVDCKEGVCSPVSAK